MNLSTSFEHFGVGHSRTTVMSCSDISRVLLLTILPTNYTSLWKNGQFFGLRFKRTVETVWDIPPGWKNGSQNWFRGPGCHQGRLKLSSSSIHGARGSLLWHTLLARCRGQTSFWNVRTIHTLGGTQSSFCPPCSTLVSMLSWHPAWKTTRYRQAYPNSHPPGGVDIRPSL